MEVVETLMLMVAVDPVVLRVVEEEVVLVMVVGLVEEEAVEVPLEFMIM